MAEASKKMQNFAQLTKAMNTKKTNINSASIKKATAKAGASNPPANPKNYSKYFN